MHKSGLGGLSLVNFATRTTAGVGTASTHDGSIYAQPFFTGDLPLLVESMGIVVSTAGTAKLKLAIYECFSSRNLYPDARLADLGELSYGVLGTTLLPAGLTLAAGTMYWLAVLYDAGTGAHQSTSDNNDDTLPSGPLGLVVGAGSSGTAATGLAVVQAYASGLPATFPAGAVGVTSIGQFPAIAIEPGL